MTSNSTLKTLLAQSAQAYEPRFGGFLSNHLPMATAALWALQREAGVSPPAAARRMTKFISHYRSQLEPVDPNGEYAKQFQFFSGAIEANGVAATLHEYLPPLISGWVKDAYHPLIRLAYGIEFENADEVAAGLAYLALCGPDDSLNQIARTAQTAAETPLAILASLAPATHEWAAGQTFTQHAATFVDLLPALTFEDNLRVVSHSALAAFDATHDFFALHLVTGCHAFRVCYPYAGPGRDVLFNLGIFTGYLAIGAPTITPLAIARSPQVTAAQLLDAATADEHDVKLAYTALAQHNYWADRSYLDVAYRYLTRNT